MKRLARTGMTVEPVVIDIDDFLGWCLVHNCPRDAKARTKYVTEKPTPFDRFDVPWVIEPELSQCAPCLAIELDTLVREVAQQHADGPQLAEHVAACSGSSRTKCVTTWNAAIPTSRKRWLKCCAFIAVKLLKKVAECCNRIHRDVRCDVPPTTTEAPRRDGEARDELPPNLAAVADPSPDLWGWVEEPLQRPVAEFRGQWPAQAGAPRSPNGIACRRRSDRQARGDLPFRHSFGMQP
jgi:hypothetical protein